MKHIATLTLRQPLSHLTTKQRAAFELLLGEFMSDLGKEANIAATEKKWGALVRFELPDVD